MPAKKKQTNTKKKAKAKKTVKKAPKRKPVAKRTAKKVGSVKKRTVGAKKTKQAKRATRRKTCSCKSKCHASEAFWVNNGPVVHSINDLLSALKGMSEEQFDHHTQRERNDFANWIKRSLKDSACATSVRRVRTRVGAVRVLSNKCSCK